VLIVDNFEIIRNSLSGFSIRLIRRFAATNPCVDGYEIIYPYKFLISTSGSYMDI